MNSILEVDSLNKKYKGNEFLSNNNISFKINKGRIVGVFGPNGAGKTTLVRIICGLMKPNSGDVRVMGNSLVNNPKLCGEYIASFSQNMYVHQSLKVIEFLTYTGIYRNMDKEKSYNESISFLKYFKSNDLKDKLIINLSGGEKRIVGFIATIIGDKPLIVLDEPTNDMDPVKRKLLWQLVRKISDERKTTFLIVTHNIIEAQELVDDVIIINKGKLIKMDEPRNLIDNNYNIKIVLNVSDGFVKDINKKWKSDDDEVTIICKKEEINKEISDIYKGNNYKYIRDIKIIHPTLYDVYIDNIGDL